jgi:hypothetical protein
VIGARTSADDEERKRLDEMSRPRLLYPHWHQANTAWDRLCREDLTLLAPTFRGDRPSFPQKATSCQSDWHEVAFCQTGRFGDLPRSAGPRTVQDMHGRLAACRAERE